MLTGEAIAKMVDFSAGNLHDVDHLLHVFGLAKAIAEGEGLDAETLHVIELAAVVHDIACPLCRKKYGSAPGKLQERESAPLVREFFAGTDEPQETVERIAWVVSHHHTYEPVEGAVHQVILEADWLVNTSEGVRDGRPAPTRPAPFFATRTGLGLFAAMFPPVAQ